MWERFGQGTCELAKPQTQAIQSTVWQSKHCWVVVQFRQANGPTRPTSCCTHSIELLLNQHEHNNTPSPSACVTMTTTLLGRVVDTAFCSAPILPHNVNYGHSRFIINFAHRGEKKFWSYELTDLRHSAWLHWDRMLTPTCLNRCAKFLQQFLFSFHLWMPFCSSISQNSTFYIAVYKFVVLLVYQ